MWVLLFSKKSALEKGTLYQLKNLINRTAVPTEPDTNLKAAEDFLLVVLHAHIVAAAEAVMSQNNIASVGELANEVVKKFLNITIPLIDELRHISQSGNSAVRSQSHSVNTSSTSQPSTSQPTSSTGQVQPSTIQHRTISSTASSNNQKKRTSQSGTNKGNNQNQSQSNSYDGVCLYAREVLSLGLIWHELHDAVKKGDGNRVIQVWKFLLVFKNSGRKNYSTEALNLLLQEQYILSERQKLQLKWGRFINTHGRQGCNVPCDLHMEHLNRRLKCIMRNMGANLTTKSITVAAKSISIVNNVCEVFESGVSTSKPNSNYHPTPSFSKDFNMILKVLNDQEVFITKRNRGHTSYKHKNGLLEQYNSEKLSEWLISKIELSDIPYT